MSADENARRSDAIANATYAYVSNVFSRNGYAFDEDIVLSPADFMYMLGDAFVAGTDFKKKTNH